MRDYIHIVLLCIIAISGISKATLYIDDPGNTVVLSSSVGDNVYVDYYTTAQPGTHLELIPGGSTWYIRLYNYGQLTFDGGSTTGEIWFYDNSFGNIISGSIGAYLRVTDNSRLTMSGGNNLSDWMGVFDNGEAEISGGTFGDLSVAHNALVTLIGSDFMIGGHSVEGLLDIPQLVDDGLLTVYDYPEYYNVQYKGVLSGMLLDGSSFISDISITHRTDGGGNTANIYLVPEPATVLLVGFGAVMLRRKRTA